MILLTFDGHLRLISSKGQGIRIFVSARRPEHRPCRFAPTHSAIRQRQDGHLSSDDDDDDDDNDDDSVAGAAHTSDSVLMPRLVRVATEAMTVQGAVASLLQRVARTLGSRHLPGTLQMQAGPPRRLSLHFCLEDLSMVQARGWDGAMTSAQPSSADLEVFHIARQDHLIFFLAQQKAREGAEAVLPPPSSLPYDLAMSGCKALLRNVVQGFIADSELATSRPEVCKRKSWQLSLLSAPNMHAPITTRLHSPRQLVRIPRSKGLPALFALRSPSPALPFV